ncbi:uncharacterized protein LOC110692563 [Chenopodium quinoa]|uniref:uncharacterized protein LOC110692563 n=1 Tax=Chenopodium quinoa TaxID=63459 RepID=UPI000B783161|nr:uncharacterized protein LOC110692563 [Chenopodium quinoa]
MGDETKIDPSSLFYLGSGDQPGNLISHVILKGENYLPWSRDMSLSLKSRRKFGFVDGTISKPTEKKKMLDWNTVNSMLVSWILRAIEPKIAASIPYFEEAKRLWEYLEKRYCEASGPRLQQLRAAITNCKHFPNMTVEDYYTQLMGYFDDLLRLKTPHGCKCGSCSCGVAAAYEKDREEEILHQFLVGIDDAKYATVRTNLLPQQPPATLDRAYQALLQEESSRSIAQTHNTVAGEDAHVFALPSDRRQFQLPNRVDKSKLYCHHCKRQGHDNAGCFVLLGYPNWWLEKYGKKGRASPSAAAASFSGQQGATSKGPASFSGQQGASTSAAAVSNSSKPPVRANVVGCSGDSPPIPQDTLSALSEFKPEHVRLLLNMVNNQKEKMSGEYFSPFWIIDTGASHHVTGDATCLMNVTDIPPCPDGAHAMATKMGRDQHLGSLIRGGERIDGLYYFWRLPKVCAVTDQEVSTFELWHRRMGHPSDRIVKLVPAISASSSSKLLNKTCDVCPQAKQTRDSFPDSDSRASLTMKCVRSNNGTEFKHMIPYFDEHGILFQTSCVGTPQQNGRVERKHQHILNVSRALMFQGNLPLTFWGECVLGVVYLINRTPSRVLDNKTPFEMLFGVAPNFDELKVFGCLCFVHNQKAKGDKFAPRSRKCVFVGYPHGKKGWKVYDLESGDIFVSRDVKFFENEFPFADDSQVGTDTMSNDNVGVDIDFLDDLVHILEIGEATLDPEPQPELHSPAASPVTAASPADSAPSSTSAAVGSLDCSPIAASSTARSQSATAGTAARHHNAGQSAAATASAPDSSSNADPSTHSSPPLNLSRDQRNIHPPGWHRDYVAHTISLPGPSISPSSSSSPSSSGTPYPLAHYVNCDKFSMRHRVFIVAIDTAVEPRNFKEAMQHEGWREAMQKEISALEDNETWIMATLPPRKKALGCRWVYKVKHNSDGTVERLKACLVIFGNHQVEGIDYNETFAPVAKMVTVRAFLAIAAAKNWELHQMDVHNALLHGDLDEEVYMKPPPGFHTSSSDSVSLVEKVYVDDLIIDGNDSSTIAQFKSYLSDYFHMNDLGVLKYFLGIEVARNSEGIFLCQRKYTLDIIAESGLLGARPAGTPIEQNHTLATSETPQVAEPEMYRRLVGRLIYLSFTRPDLAYTVHILSQFMQHPRQAHWEAALRTVRWCGADWASCPLSRRSITGWLVFLGNSPISWKTKKQDIVAKSSAKSEYRSMSKATDELKCQSALYIAQNPVFHERAKHIEVDCHYVRDAIQDGIISTSYVKTTDQLGDIFTKALGKSQFLYLLDNLSSQTGVHLGSNMQPLRNLQSNSQTDEEVTSRLQPLRNPHSNSPIGSESMRKKLKEASPCHNNYPPMFPRHSPAILNFNGVESGTKQQQQLVVGLEASASNNTNVALDPSPSDAGAIDQYGSNVIIACEPCENLERSTSPSNPRSLPSQSLLNPGFNRAPSHQLLPRFVSPNQPGVSSQQRPRIQQSDHVIPSIGRPRLISPNQPGISSQQRPRLQQSDHMIPSIGNQQGLAYPHSVKSHQGGSITSSNNILARAFQDGQKIGDSNNKMLDEVNPLVQSSLSSRKKIKAGEQSKVPVNMAAREGSSATDMHRNEFTTE